MSNQDFLKHIPFSNLAGSRLKNTLFLYRHHRIHPRFWHKAGFNLLASVIFLLPAGLERILWKFRLPGMPVLQPPLFILGHWRSGTTHLHNLFCLDERAGFSSTYQTVFPNNLLVLRKTVQWFMKTLMPAERPVDDMPLHPDLPQEEEFGLGNIFELCYYHWWYFPDDWDVFIDRYLSLDQLAGKDRERWQRTYVDYIRKGLYIQRKSWFVSKNPPHTARISLLLDTFPDARFVHIRRNPYEVFESTRSFFKAVLGPLRLQEITDDELENHILRAWCAMHDAYQKQKLLLPPNRLVELDYESFTQNEAFYMRDMYLRLELSIPEGLEEKWLGAVSGKPRSPRKFDGRTVELVNKALAHRIEEMGYKRLS